MPGSMPNLSKIKKLLKGHTNNSGMFDHVCSCAPFLGESASLSTFKIRPFGCENRLAFALYGPVVNGVPQAEVLRSHLWHVRELVEVGP